MAVTPVSQRKIEMQWTCSACGQVNLGRHMVCQRCGDPKDAAERYEMPSDTAAAPTVTDPELLRLAHAGPNWRCSYCASDQRRADGACARCGAAQREGKSTAGESAARGAMAAPRVEAARSPARTILPIGLLAGTLLLCGASAFAMVAISRTSAPPPMPLRAEPPGPRLLDATVTAVSWVHRVHVERYHVVEREGFAESRPEGAFDVESLGQRVHHHEQVPDGFRDESYTEQVPYQDTESYTEQVQCGEDCTDIPQTCSETCTPDDNGFATCTTHCSGGGRSCSPRYCTEHRTRPVTRYRPEQRTRQVQAFREEPRHAEYFRFKVWDWTADRTIERRGTTEPPVWPTDDELQPPAPLAEGEQERTRRQADYDVVMTDSDGGSVTLHPESLDEHGGYQPGARFRIERPPYGGPVRVLGRL